jgi:pyrimidine-nucleoside phosphorylase
MLARSLIERKRDGGRLTREEWQALADAYLRGELADYQMSAFLMAAFIRGLDEDETVSLTRTMLESGDRLRLAEFGTARIDKHSTGGVGDKVSLVLAPLVASCGVMVPMISGRGLGHTGGTLDKLESIPGFRTDLSLERATDQLARLGCVLIGQTREIAPLDRRLYALRDATCTVEAIPMIAASIMSKKLAEDLTGLVLDVKQGAGAFIPDEARGLELARTMISLGESYGCPVVALLTAMDRPLGHACGNALEVEEAIHALKGEGPADLMEVTLALAGEMLLLAGVEKDRSAARTRLHAAIASGAAAHLFQRIIEEQGGNPGVVDDPAALPQAPVSAVFEAARAGVVLEVNPRAVGLGIIELGGGRSRMEDVVNPAVGFVITAKPGLEVAEGQPLATVHAADEAGLERGLKTLREAIRLGHPGERVRQLPLVSWRVTNTGAERWMGDAS